MESDALKELMEMSRPGGRVLEPQAKRMFRMAGLDVPRFVWTESPETALRFAAEIGYPVVAKVVSPQIYCKSDCSGVEPCVPDAATLLEVFQRFSRVKGAAGVMVEERHTGLELNVGVTKIDYRYGPAIFLERVRPAPERQRNVTYRFPPIEEWSVTAMMKDLGIYSMFNETRGIQPFEVKELSRLLITLSRLCVGMGDRLEGMFLNPIVCGPERCVVLDARIKFANWQPHPAAAMGPAMQYATA